MPIPYVTPDPIRITAEGVFVGDKLIQGVTRWTSRHEPDRGTFEVTLTLATGSFHAELDAPEGQILGGPRTAVGPAVAWEKMRTANLLEGAIGQNREGK